MNLNIYTPLPRLAKITFECNITLGQAKLLYISDLSFYFAKDPEVSFAREYCRMLTYDTRLAALEAGVHLRLESSYFTRNKYQYQKKKYEVLCRSFHRGYTKYEVRFLNEKSFDPKDLT